MNGMNIGNQPMLVLRKSLTYQLYPRFSNHPSCCQMQTPSSICSFVYLAILQDQAGLVHQVILGGRKNRHC